MTAGRVAIRLSICLAACVVLTVLAGASAPAAEEPYTLGSILQAWKTRQAQVDTAKFEFSESMFYPKGKLALGRDPKPGKQAPETDVTVERRVLVLIGRGGRLRYEREEKTWEENLGEFVSQHYVSAMDGKANKTFYGKGSIGEEFHPCGFVNTDQMSLDARNYHVMPFLVFARPLDEAVGGFTRQGLSLGDQRPTVDDRPCLVMERFSRGFNEEYWVDPARTFIVVRAIRRSKGEELFRLSCSYAKDERHGWIPSSWEASVFDRGHQINESARGQMIRYEINPALKDEDFQFAFPPGTEVMDNVQKKRYVPLESGAIVHLANESYVSALAPPKRTRLVLYLVMGAALLVVLFILYRLRVARAA